MVGIILVLKISSHNPGTCGYATLHGRWDFSDAIKIMGFKLSGIFWIIEANSMQSYKTLKAEKEVRRGKQKGYV